MATEPTSNAPPSATSRANQPSRCVPDYRVGRLLTSGKTDLRIGVRGDGAGDFYLKAENVGVPIQCHQRGDRAFGRDLPDAIRLRHIEIPRGIRGDGRTSVIGGWLLEPQCSGNG